jgi:Ca-activated chloride channel family protein
MQSNQSSPRSPGAVTLALAVTMALSTLSACHTAVSPQGQSAKPAETSAPQGELRADAEAAPSAAQPAPVLYEFKSEQEDAGAAMDKLARAQVRQRQLAPPLAPSNAIVSMGYQPPPVDRETYAVIEDLGLMLTQDDPVSTFSVDVDTGAYANVRRFVNEGALPPTDAVRVEELINYFNYDYAEPSGSTPFSVQTEIATTPWNPDTLLMQIGIQGKSIPADKRPASNLVFLIDVSGSMQSPNKLPLLKKAFTLLTNNLNDRDRVSMVVYAGASGVVLPPTAGDDGQRILEALERLRAGGSTNGASGLKLAYQTARDAFIEGGINRIVLATDGDFNVGIANVERVIDLVERERETGISLTTLGFGSGNYNDELMERIADAGNGNYAYIDSVSEARKVLVDEIGSTLHTIAKDVKIQVEFNPAQIAEYRLIGYQNRMLKREDFNNDKVDAGDIGAGHTVTALYELTPVDSAARKVDPLRYGQSVEPSANTSNELAFVRLRYKAPDGDTSKLIERPVNQSDVIDARRTSDDYRFAAAVAAFGQQLRGEPLIGDYQMSETRALAAGAPGNDRGGYRRDFLELIDRTTSLDHDNSGQSNSGHAIAGKF